MNKILTVAVLAFAICSTSGVFAESSQEQIVAEQSCGAGQLWMPPGSNVVSSDSGALEIDPPAGFFYIGRDGAGQANLMTNATCSCKCTSSKGTCSPSIFGKDCSCTAKAGCTSCDLSTTASVAVLTDLGVEVTGPVVAVENGGFVDFRAGVRFATAEDGDLPLVFADMFKVAPVAAALDAFFAESHLRGIGAPEMIPEEDQFVAPEGFQLAKVNVFGRAGLVLVPSPWSDGPENLLVSGGGDSSSCSCTAGSCTYATKWTLYGTLYYCDGNCKGTCTLTMMAAAQIELSAFSRSAH